jgi:hypothetical protein
MPKSRRISTKTVHPQEACYLLHEMIQKAFAELPALTTNYRHIQKALQGSSPKIVFDGVADYARLANNPAFREYFSAKEMESGAYKSRVAGVIRSQLENALRRTAAASLVFAHSVFEDCVSILLRITCEACPDDWQPLVASKKIEISQVLTKSKGDILLQLVQEHLRSLEHQSLATKLNTFFKVVRPPKNKRRFPNFTYSPHRIEEIDQTRHTVTHNDSLAYDPIRLDDDIQYLTTSLIWLGTMLIDKYHLRSEIRPTN